MTAPPSISPSTGDALPISPNQHSPRSASLPILPNQSVILDLHEPRGCLPPLPIPTIRRAGLRPLALSPSPDKLG
jgi:hypothetical protein